MMQALSFNSLCGLKNKLFSIMSESLEEISEFQSMSEFSRFEAWLNRELNVGAAKEVFVDDFYAGINFKERWFCFGLIGEVWRLVYPDGPFKGYWGKV